MNLSYLCFTCHLCIHFINTKSLAFNNIELRVNPSKKIGCCKKKESFGRPGMWGTERLGRKTLLVIGSLIMMVFHISNEKR
ncbi:hypothetical protein H8356DRAFT_133867 [Neocallimastix lanati (nom. inval.)]|nr:hypothetical protein H8356DRAFT_133867 [Neocallimastix sp. JGI-2020a]